MKRPPHILVALLGPLMLIFSGVFATWPVAAAQSNQRCFPETGQCIVGRFYEFWQDGGLSIFGYPISPARYELDPNTGKALFVQWFERARFEYHPYNAPAYQVELGLLGRQLIQTARLVAPGPRQTVKVYLIDPRVPFDATRRTGLVPIEVQITPTKRVLRAATGAWWTKQFSIRVAFLGSLIIRSLALLITGTTTNYAVLMALRFLGGVGTAVAFVLGSSLAARIRHHLLPVYFAGAGIGIVLSGMVVPIALTANGATGWRVGWLVLAMMPITRLPSGVVSIARAAVSSSGHSLAGIVHHPQHLGGQRISDHLNRCPVSRHLSVLVVGGNSDKVIADLTYTASSC